MLRRTLLLLLAAVCFACSGGDDDSDSGSPSDASDKASSTAPPAADAAGYTDEVRTRFVGSCTAGGGTEDYCRCAIDAIATTVPLADFTAFEAAILAAPNPTIPAPIATALASCT